MEYIMIASSVFALIVLNIVMLTFIKHSSNIVFSRLLMLVGSLIYTIALIFSYKIAYIIGQNTIFIGIAFGIYGLYKHKISNLPIILFSISFIIIEFLAHILNIKILMFSSRTSGFSISTLLSLLLPLGIGIITHLVIHKKTRHKN